ncbi:bifunctional cytidylate kinase/GTPase Der [Corynebacterium pseudodiphtheriticum]|uniref:bifunctional cytidylate kinase/GTPase Der n=1 Tax=Corynebacterium pseudodiphtheriticum TaxID=37637 RepID=UPI0025519946|nr:bifunctional cytidylate kinase/GTPase Der [Corynebacterium pseudodiphtheriticum]MDK8760616.1 bifunctional cytidylate kinase/GTPase Der [Corynebacterium pseudodiphtheriticum]
MITNMPDDGLLVAVDGPSGTGKSSTCRALAKQLDAKYLDTGAMYRVATLAVLRAQVDPLDSYAVIEATRDLPIEISDDPESSAVLLDGEDVSEPIRGQAVTTHVSSVSAIPEVRENLVQLQRELAFAAHRVIVEGRDIGTVVLGDAPTKIFLTASAEIRAQRRHDQNLAAGRESSFSAVLADVQRRDAADSARAASPLRPADDAVLVDTSELTLEEVQQKIINIIQSAGLTESGNLDASNDFASAYREYTGDDFDETEFSVADAERGEDEPDWDELEEEFLSSLGGTQVEEALCTVAIVGRPNVGKSSLTNRFLGRREAVVEDVPGVTRDRNSYLAEWANQRFWVQDTGGWDSNVKGLNAHIARQAEVAMDTADVIIFVVDTRVGATETDIMMARKLQRSKVPVLLVANKFDSPQQYADLSLFYSLGLGDPWPVSALHGNGSADVLDEMLRLFPETPRQTSITSGPRKVALVGKPNVGKSSLLNKFANEERSVVDNVAGTTVDPVDSMVQLDEQMWRFIDTAGLRKKVKNAQGHEYYASLRTRGVIDAAEVCVLLIDASEPISEQDQRVLAMILESGKALVLALNKWDLMEEERRFLLERELEQQLRHIPWATRVNISAKTGRALNKLEPAMIAALESWDKRVTTGQLNNWIREAIAANPPPMKNNRLPKVLFATQAGTQPPTIVLFTTGFLDAGYRRYLERKFRERFGFHGTPVRIAVRVRERKTKRK